MLDRHLKVADDGSNKGANICPVYRSDARLPSRHSSVHFMRSCGRARKMVLFGDHLTNHVHSDTSCTLNEYSTGSTCSGQLFNSGDRHRIDNQCEEASTKSCRRRKEHGLLFCVKFRNFLRFGEPINALFSSTEESRGLPCRNVEILD